MTVFPRPFTLSSMKQHVWMDNATNANGDVLEQKCACGAYRHRYLIAMVGWADWINGEHPSARLHRKRRARGFPDGYCP